MPNINPRSLGKNQFMNRLKLQQNKLTEKERDIKAHAEKTWMSAVDVFVDEVAVAIEDKVNEKLTEIEERSKTERLKGQRDIQIDIYPYRERGISDDVFDIVRNPPAGKKNIAQEFVQDLLQMKVESSFPGFEWIYAVDTHHPSKNIAGVHMKTWIDFDEIEVH